MSAKTWLDSLRVAIQPLLSPGGFRVTRESSDPKFFGNARVVLESANLRLRFVVDRAQFHAAVGAKSAPPEEWFILKSVLTALHVYDGALGPWKNLDEPVRLALDHRALLEAAAESGFQIVGGQVRRAPP